MPNAFYKTGSQTAYKTLGLHFVKCAVDIATLRQGAKRIPGVSPFPKNLDILPEFGAITIPTKAHMSEAQRPAVKKIYNMQKKMMPAELHKAIGKDIETVHGQGAGAGRILIGPNFDRTLIPKASKQLKRDLRAFTTLHESAERRAVTAPGSLHVSPQVLMKDINLLHNVEGRGAQPLSRAMLQVRAPEIQHLYKQLSKLYGPRVEQFLQPGTKIPKAMRKAVSKENLRITPRQAMNISMQQAATAGLV